MKRRPQVAKCAGCGHRLSQHTTYKNGTNRYGCRLVCTVEGCMRWNQCLEPQSREQSPGTDASHLGRDHDGE